MMKAATDTKAAKGTKVTKGAKAAKASQNDRSIPEALRILFKVPFGRSFV